MNKLTCLTAIIALTLVSGCERPVENPAPTELAEVRELRLELEQLANAVGRLEFRIYELESRQAEIQPAMNAEESATAVSQQPADGKRYDLAPAE